MNVSDRKKLLDYKLKTILVQTQVSWKNLDRINEIKKAILSGSEYLKKSVIKKL